MTLDLVVGAATIVIVYVIYRLHSTHKGAGRANAPPSLPSLPIIGSLPFLSGLGALYKCLTNKTKRYGNVYSFYAGSKYTLVINGYHAIHEALVKRAADFAGRGPFYNENNVWNVRGCGVIFKQYGEVYKKNRLHSVAVLKQFGFGDRRIMEVKIHVEVGHLLEHVRARNGTAFDPSDIFGLSTLNVINDLLFSERFKLGDPTEIYLRSTVRYFADTTDPLVDLFPFVVHLPKYRKQIDALRPVSAEFKKFFDDKIQQSLQRRDGEDNFVNEYIKRVGAEYDGDELSYLLRDFIMAGMETTSTLLCWATILLGNHPEVLARLQKELDAVVPRDRLPSMDDKAKLPFMEAFILESLRFRTIVAAGITHYTLCETELAGYKIPANAIVLVNHWSASMDPTVFTEPDKFRPGRFLDATGRVKDRELMIAFSLGKRACIGEVLALQELFLFISALVQQFNILPPEGETSIKDEIKFVRLLAPAPFEVSFVPRAQSFE